MSLSVASPTDGVLQVAGAVVIGTIVDGVFAQLVSGGNATVPSDAPIQPPQAFVDCNTQLFQFGNANFSTIPVSRFDGTLAGNFVQFEVLLGGDPNFVVNNAGSSLPVGDINGILSAIAGLIGIVGPGSIDLSGGTNAAPTGQGLTDKQTLIDAGWTVTTN